jgi:hypothetical protein
MDILQIILALGVFGTIGGIIYWFGIALGAGVKSTQDDINKDPRFK